MLRGSGRPSSRTEPRFARSVQGSIDRPKALPQGLIRYLGLSNWAAWQIAKSLGISSLYGMAKFSSLHAYYTIVGRDLEREIVPMLSNEGLGLLVWTPLARGLLSGEYGRQQKDAFEFLPVNIDRAYSVIDVLHEIAEREIRLGGTLAIVWLLHQPRVTSVILGTKRIEQLNEKLGAVDILLTGEELRSLDQVSQLPPEYPGWTLEMWSQPRAKQLKDSRT